MTRPLAKLDPLDLDNRHLALGLVTARSSETRLFIDRGFRVTVHRTLLILDTLIRESEKREVTGIPAREEKLSQPFDFQMLAGLLKL